MSWWHLTAAVLVWSALAIVTRTLINSLSEDRELDWVDTALAWLFPLFWVVVVSVWLHSQVESFLRRHRS